MLLSTHCSFCIAAFLKASATLLFYCLAYWANHHHFDYFFSGAVEKIKGK